MVGSRLFPEALSADVDELRGPVAVAVTSGDRPNLAFRPRSDADPLKTTLVGGGRLSDPAGTRFAVRHRGPRGTDLAIEDAGPADPRILTRRPHDENPVTWSPDGRLLVYRNGWMGDDGVHYQRRLRTLDVEIGEDRALADVPVAAHSTVSWSPSGAWFVFDGRSEDGDLDLWTVRPDGSELRRLTRDPQDDAGPVWRNESRLLFLSTRGPETDVWEYDLDGDRRRHLTSTGRISRLLADARRFTPGRWIDRLRLAPPTDTLELASREQLLRPCPTLLAEDWTGGVDPERWYAGGDPTAAVVAGGSRSPAALSERGDAHYDGGIATTESFSTEHGLTVEAWGRIPLTGRHYQVFTLGMAPGAPAILSDQSGWRGAPPFLKFSISGRPGPPRLYVAGAENPFPLPDSLPSWHRYALQLHPDGRRSLAVDGRILWVEPPSGLDARPPRVRVSMSGRTVGTDILVGPLRIYGGVRYVIP